jgi:hypothetical protein
MIGLVRTVHYSENEDRDVNHRGGLYYHHRRPFAATLDEGNDAPDTEIGRAEGPAMMTHLALVDAVEIGKHQLAITRAGAIYFEQDEVTISEIAAAHPLLIKPALEHSTQSGPA